MTRTMTRSERKIHRAAKGNCRWHDVELMPYKEDDQKQFRSISRQVLFSDAQLSGELRYFEMAPGGHSSLERHQHMHGVLIFRGRGHCLVGCQVIAVESGDLITVPPWTWHQFRATLGEPLGFLCMVDANRDKPQLPSPADLEELQADPAIAAFLRGRADKS
jgi:mannose-6-phosphate isomerase-like protein (cupin superfamily)